MNIEAHCAPPPKSLTYSPTQTPLGCPVAPPSQRELHKDGGGGGGGVARRAGPRRPSSAPRPVECPPQRPSQRPAPRPSRARLSRVAQGQRGGGARVLGVGSAAGRWRWTPRQTDGHLHADVPRGAHHALRYVLHSRRTCHGTWRRTWPLGPGRRAPSSPRHHRHRRRLCAFVQLALIWGRNWAAHQWHLGRAVGKSFRGCRAKRASKLIADRDIWWLHVVIQPTAWHPL